MKEWWRQNKVLLQSLIVLAGLLGLYTWDNLVSAATGLTSALHLADTFFSGQWWVGRLYGIPLLRILIGVLILGVALNTFFAVRYRNRPVSVLRTDITFLITDGGKCVISHRRQWVRANHPSVRAYFIKSTLEQPGAKFDKPTQAWLEANSGPLTVSPKDMNRGATREIDLEYSGELPYSWFVPLIPRWCLIFEPNTLPSFLKRYVTVQNVRLEMHGEYQFGAARYSMRSTRYQHHTVSLKLDFSQEGDSAKRPQSAGTIGVSRRLSNAVITEYAQPEGAMNVYTVNIADGVGKDEEVTVTW